MKTKPVQISVMAVAALAVVAVAAAILLIGGGAPAQATTATYAPPTGDGIDLGRVQQTTDPTPTPTPTPPRHASPEPCPGETGNPNEAAALAVSSGHIALFDAWWNDEELEPTNNSCPPTVVHVPEREDDDGNTIPASDTRSPSSINIAETVIHIPSSAMVTLNETDYPKTQYKAVWDADDKENPEGDGDRVVWALPACPPNGTPAANGLCLSFSAALLNDADWDGDITFHLDHVHQIDIDKQDARYVLAYHVLNGQSKLHWDSSNAKKSMMPVAPGGYQRPMWFFTSRGTYQFQVHITGDPERNAANLGGQDPIIDNDSVNGDVRTYVLHVGEEADLGVGVTVEPADSADTSLDPGDNVTITVTASNAGPDTATNTEVEVNLPAGLINPTSTTTSYDSGTGVWTIGDLAVTDDDNSSTSDDSPTLEITATVAPETHGQELAVKATISATETLTIKELGKNEQTGQKAVVEQTYTVPVLDPVSDNNMATGTTTVASSSNGAPMFFVTRSVDENAAADTTVGDPVPVKDPNPGDTLTFGLTGDGAADFVAEAGVNGYAQIKVAAGAAIDYETHRSYDLVLTVSDGKNDAGNVDTSVDHTIGLSINVNDVDEFAATLAVSNTAPRVGEAVTFTVTIQHPPVFIGQLSYILVEMTDGAETSRVGGSGQYGPVNHTKSEAGTHTYYLDYWFWDGTEQTHQIQTNHVTVTWSE